MALKKREYIYITLFALFCPLTILAFISAVAHIEIDKLIFSEGHLLSLVGIIVSTVGLIFTVYFVVLAVSARKIQIDIDNAQDRCNELNNQKEQLKSEFIKLDGIREKNQTDLSEITKQVEILNKSTNEYKSSKKELENLLRDYAQSLFDGLETQIALAELSKSVKLRNMLMLEQARLSYRYPKLDKQIRLTLLLRLADIGEVKDIYNIEMITYNPDDDNEIKKCAETVLDNLKKKFEIF